MNNETQAIQYVPDIFGELVFNDNVMKERLPKETYRSLKKTIEEGLDLDIGVANVVANAMKDWAIEKGATHYTHWFQPLTGITAEKHDSFINPQPDGSVIMEFSGKELIKGEPDASSFPSGGLRATFEARGYTAWDPTSYAFIKDGSLCIPTAFCSYGGEVLDKKTPLLRSIELIGAASVRVLNLMGHKDVTKVNCTVGPEQEYFLVDKKYFDRRKDLIFTGRTLFGAMPPKGQEMDDHYFGAIKPRVAEYMKDLDRELWRLGVLAKTKHNEVAPAQHELAPIFSNANIANDHNQLTMEIMKKVALRHDLVCLLHEKPFAGVNGSGKHNNWSLSTNTGINILKPGKKPRENKIFLVFLAAVIRAVDENQDLLRISVASPGNDHRFGANEAPPTIVSMFLGDELSEVVESIVSGHEQNGTERKMLETGVHVLPNIKRDTTDRNRTSPFAFTGNKFEFRMPGSASSIADCNIVLNTAVADVLEDFAERLEKAADIEAETDAFVKETITAHRRIIFDGNNYSAEWVEEAERRGLLNYKSSCEAFPHFADEKNVRLFTKHKIFSEEEVRSRTEILLENYCKVVKIEALTAVDMAKKEIIPAVLKYTDSLAEGMAAKANIGIEDKTEKEVLTKCVALCGEMSDKVKSLEKAIADAENIADLEEKSLFYRKVICADMLSLRKSADELETSVGEDFWPFPTYAELLFGVK